MKIVASLLLVALSLPLLYFAKVDVERTSQQEDPWRIEWWPYHAQVEGKAIAFDFPVYRNGDPSVIFDTSPVYDAFAGGYRFAGTTVGFEVGPVKIRSRYGYFIGLSRRDAFAAVDSPGALLDAVRLMREREGVSSIGDRSPNRLQSIQIETFGGRDWVVERYVSNDARGVPSLSFYWYPWNADYILRVNARYGTEGQLGPGEVERVRALVERMIASILIEPTGSTR